MEDAVKRLGMIEILEGADPKTFLQFDELIDVRSPAEYAEDRLPGAINLPVLNDNERAEVGTIYVQKSRFLSRRIGAAMVARNIARHLETALADKPSTYRPLVYCWRGGMRSGAMATILSQVGWRVSRLEGGYKTWRRAVVAGLRDEAAPFNLILLDGQTGTAKSDLLRRARERGAQTLDLEALARHRGSVFGALPDREQPTQKLFESTLWRELALFDAARPVLVEAESARIGALVLPKRLWKSMLAAPRIVVRAAPQARADFLVRAYAGLIDAPGGVEASLEKLQFFHSKTLLDAWREMAARGDFVQLADSLMREHYDPLYDRSRKRRADAPLAELVLPDLGEESLEGAATEISALIENGP